MGADKNSIVHRIGTICMPLVRAGGVTALHLSVGRMLVRSGGRGSDNERRPFGQVEATVEISHGSQVYFAPLTASFPHDSYDIPLCLAGQDMTNSNLHTTQFQVPTCLQISLQLTIRSGMTSSTATTSNKSIPRHLRLPSHVRCLVSPVTLDFIKD